MFLFGVWHLAQKKHTCTKQLVGYSPTHWRQQKKLAHSAWIVCAWSEVRRARFWAGDVDYSELKLGRFVKIKVPHRQRWTMSSSVGRAWTVSSDILKLALRGARSTLEFSVFLFDVSDQHSSYIIGWLGLTAAVNVIQNVAVSFMHLDTHRHLGSNKLQYFKHCELSLHTISTSLITFSPLLIFSMYLQLDLVHGTICRRTSDSRTYHTAVSDSCWRRFLVSVNSPFNCTLEILLTYLVYILRFEFYRICCSWINERRF